MPSAKNQQIWWLKLNGKTTAPKFGSRTFLYCPFYYYKNKIIIRTAKDYYYKNRLETKGSRFDSRC